MVEGVEVCIVFLEDEFAEELLLWGAAGMLEM